MNELDMHGRVPNATAFTQSVQIFLENSAGATFRDSVVFGEKGITATQLICYTKQIVDGTFAVSTMDNLRRTVREAAPALDPGAYSGFFLFFDGFKLITKETIRNVIMAGAVVFIITTIILANIVAAALVTLMIALTDTMLFGRSSSLICSHQDSCFGLSELQTVVQLCRFYVVCGIVLQHSDCHQYGLGSWNCCRLFSTHSTLFSCSERVS